MGIVESVKLAPGLIVSIDLRLWVAEAMVLESKFGGGQGHW